MSDDFFEDDEPVEDVLAAFDQGAKSLTEAAHQRSETIYYPLTVGAEQDTHFDVQRTGTTAATQTGDLVSA